MGRFLHGSPKATNSPPKTTSCSLQEERFGKDRPQIHRYHLQIRTRSITPSKRRGSSWDHSRRRSSLPSVSTTKQSFKIKKRIFNKYHLFCSVLNKLSTFIFRL